MPTRNIKDFFKNQTIFLTGGSGFVGKVLIEKLLRECSDLKKIYVLLRQKKGKTPQQRFDELFNYACFNLIRSNKDLLQKVHLIDGDCHKPFLGLSESDLEVLKKETTTVIHAAANVKFDQTLKEATYMARAMKDILEIAHQMTNLKVFIFVSTAYSNCIHKLIKEEFYEPPITAERLFSLVDALDDDVLETITPKILGQWPNTYVYVKNVAENLIKTEGQGLSIAVVRPSIVISSVKEPIPGWIDNFYGPIGIVAGAALGVIRSLNINKNNRTSMVPVDYVCNCVLAAAWKNQNSDTIKIYNNVGDSKNTMTWDDFMKKIYVSCWKAPSEKVIWYYSLKLRSSRISHKIFVFFAHTLVAYVVDFGLVCMRRPPIAVKSYERLHKMLDLLSYFGVREWDFVDDNVVELWDGMCDADKERFNFDMEYFNWDDYILKSVFGAREFLLKDTLDTIPRGERKVRILIVAHYTILAIFWFLVYKLVSFIFHLFY